MKLLWMNHRDIKSPKAGGAERSIYEISRRLVKRGIDVTIICGSGNGIPRREIYDNIKVLRFGKIVLPHIAEVVVLLKRSKFDLIIDDLAHGIPWFSPFITNVPGIAFFRHLHLRTNENSVPYGLSPMLSLIEKNYRKLYGHWHFVTESEQSVQDLVALNIDPKRIARLPPGVDTELFRPSKKYDRPTIVYFGGFRPYKRPYHALQAFTKVKQEITDAKLLMIGRGKLFKEMSSEYQHKNKSGDVEFLVVDSNIELAEIVAKSWVNIHTSTAEGWGYSIMEASACGTPTVAYDVPGVSESIIDGENGYLVSNSSIDELSKMIIYSLNNPNTLNESAIKYASKFNWDDTVSKLIAYFDNVIK